MDSTLVINSTMWDKLVDYITNSALWVGLLLILLKVIVIILVLRIGMAVAKRITNQIFKQRQSRRFQFDERRLNTLSTLMNNIIEYTGNFIIILLVLSQFDIRLGPLLAGAGVVGLAIGFGAQNLVRDVITGFFIIFEDQFGVGDYITTGNFSGTVTQIGLRITKLKSATGEVHIIPNGSIVEVTNYSVNNSVAVIDIGIAYEEDVEKATQALEDIVIKTSKQLDVLVGEPKVLGVQQLGPSEIVLRVTAECLPMQHFHVSRVFRSEIKKGFDEYGIEIPYPKMVTYHKSAETTVKG